MSYNFNHIKINLAGPNGNVFALMALGNNLIRQVEGKEAAEEFHKKVFIDKKEFYSKMDLEHNWYEEILKSYQDKIGWVYTSSHDLGYKEIEVKIIDHSEVFWQPQYY